MIENIPNDERRPRLTAANLPAAETDAFLKLLQACSEALDEKAVSSPQLLQDDQTRLQDAFAKGRALVATMPLKSQRNTEQKRAVEAILMPLHEATWRFFRRHAVALYRDLTDEGRRSLRVDDLLWEAAARLPVILPTQQELVQEAENMQKDKDGLEIPQGLFVSQVLCDRACGSHLIRSMLRPTAQARSLLDAFVRDGGIDLGTVKIQVEGETAYVYLHNERYLNSEDDTTVIPLEVAFDLVLLHPNVKMGVLRGSVVEHPKYKGRRVFCSGINLTRIYQGKQSYMSFLYRNMAMHSKLYRGILAGDFVDSLDAPLNEPENTLEKLWVAVVDTFAIGGGCQLLLVVDYVIAESGSYFNLPARKEGILPGASNMRLPRFVGERLAREAIMFDKKFVADTPEGRMIANEVVSADQIDDAVRACVENAVGSGMVSAGGNRKAIRVQTEPFDQYRNYMATYAREQAFCHLSDQLIANLEKHWNAKERKL